MSTRPPLIFGNPHANMKPDLTLTIKIETATGRTSFNASAAIQPLQIISIANGLIQSCLKMITEQSSLIIDPNKSKTQEPQPPQSKPNGEEKDNH